MRPVRAAAPLGLLALLACTPALDWRRTSIDGAAVLFPCKPKTQVRRVLLGTQSAQMSVTACRAAQATFAVSHAQLERPDAAAAALAALREATLANLDAAAPARDRIDVAGQPAERVRAEGHRPDGEPARLEAVFLARGADLWQASIVSADRPDAEAAETFFGSLALPR